MSEFPSDPEKSLASQRNGRPEFYYDSALTTFWVKDGRSSWMRVTEGSVKARLKKLGYRGKAQEGESISPVDLMVVDIQDHHNIDYAGSLAGWKSGVYTINEKRILVRDSPKLIEARPGQWPLIQGTILNMFGPEQQVYLFGWLKAGIESLHSSTPRVGQILCMAGQKDCGKSLLQNLFTELLGGRSEKAHRYSSGETAFNSELFGAEHLMFEDEEASTDIRSRRKFGVKLKEIASNTAHSCHAKHRTALKLPPFWRASVSLNDEPENLLILPPLDDSMLDKFIILKAIKHAMPMKTASSEQYKIFWDELRKELPHFKDFLLNFKIPSELESQRYGITHYQNPEILHSLQKLAPEIHLLELIDTQIFSGLDDSWEGTATELQQRLTANNSPVQYEARKLLTWYGACGTYLGRLQKLYPKRFKNIHTKSENRWEMSKYDQ